MQGALESHVSPQCGDGIEFKNLKTRFACKLKFDWNSMLHQTFRDLNALNGSGPSQAHPYIDWEFLHCTHGKCFKN